MNDAGYEKNHTGIDGGCHQPFRGRMWKAIPKDGNEAGAQEHMLQTVRKSQQARGGRYFYSAFALPFAPSPSLDVG